MNEPIFHPLLRVSRAKESVFPSFVLYIYSFVYVVFSLSLETLTEHIGRVLASLRQRITPSKTFHSQLTMRIINSKDEECFHSSHHQFSIATIHHQCDIFERIFLHHLIRSIAMDMYYTHDTYFI